LLAELDGRECDEAVQAAGALLATVLGQDLDQEGGVFRIARRVAKDRVISTVDPQARHGHKTAARGFDGYKGHIRVDPDSEIITATVVGAGNGGVAVAAQELIGDLLGEHTTATTTENATAENATVEVDGAVAAVAAVAGIAVAVAATAAAVAAAGDAAAVDAAADRACVYGDYPDLLAMPTSPRIRFPGNGPGSGEVGIIQR